MSLEGAAPGVAKEATCSTCGQLLMVSNHRTEILVAVVTHYNDEHGGCPSLILESREVDGVSGPAHYDVHPAPHRCDVCNDVAERPWWTYVTPASEEYYVEDPEWLVCAGCRPSVEARDLETLMARNLAVTTVQSGLPAKAIAKRLAPILKGFLEHIVGEPVYTDV